METIDLTDSYVVLGSGLSGLATARELLKSGSRRVALIDVGFDELTKVETSEFTKQRKKFTSPKFKNEAKSYTYALFTDWTNILENEFVSIGSFAKGGLSNLWGGGVTPYSKRDLNSFPYHFDDINEISQEVADLITSGLGLTASSEFIDDRCLELINSSDENIHGLHVAKAQNAVCFLDENASYMDKSEQLPRHKVFNAKLEIDKLCSHPNFDYYPRNFIHNIEKIGDYYHLNCFDTETRASKQFLLRHVFCSLGTLSTTKLVLGMEKAFDMPIKLHNTPMASFLLYSFKHRRVGLPQVSVNNIFAHATYKQTLGDDEVNGCIFPFPADVFFRYPRKSVLGRLIYKVVDYFLFSRLLIGTINFPSSYSENLATLTPKNDFVLSANKPLTKLTTGYKNVKKGLKAFFADKHYFLVPFVGKLFKPGEDIHFGGTLPMKEHPKRLQCNKNGELFNNKNFFITDPSSMTSLAGKGHSFNSMVQSTLIVKKFLERETTK